MATAASPPAPIALIAPIVSKPRHLRDLGPVDATALRDTVVAVSDHAWANEDAAKENDFAVFHHTRHIVFRFIADNRDPLCFYDNPGWRVWQPLLMPVIEQAIAPYGLRDPEIPKAMLARLAAGAVIDRHVDGAGSNLRTHKIHVPLVTDPSVSMQLGDRAFHLAAGRAYEVNNIGYHGVTNPSATDRIHFIFEVFDRARRAAPRRGRDGHARRPPAMIVSFSRRFVFVAIPKTAGHAVRHWLRGALAPNDWEQCTLFEQRLFPVPALAAIGHGHLGADDIAPWLLPGMWARFFSFGVVRDPFDRFRSFCAFFAPEIAASGDRRGDMKRLLETRRDHILLRPQHRFVCDANGELRVSFLARYERLSADMATVAARIGVAPAELARVNVSPARMDQPLDRELQERIADLYADDFALFGYAKRLS